MQVGAALGLAVLATLSATRSESLIAQGDSTAVALTGSYAFAFWIGAALGLLDELQLHIVPVLLGGGIRLFDGLDHDRIELEGTRVIGSPAVTHLRFRVVK